MRAPSGEICASLTPWTRVRSSATIARLAVLRSTGSIMGTLLGRSRWGQCRHAAPTTATALSDAPSTATASISITIRSCASPPITVVRAGYGGVKNA